MILEIIISYLIGSLPTGYLLCKFFKNIDIRKYGSGSTGSTNVLRITKSKKLAIITLITDLLKGATVILLFGTQYLCLFFVLIGHVYSVWLNFKGGKGVATSAGIFIVLSPTTALCSIIIWLLSLKLFKISSIASLSMSASFLLLNIIQHFYKKEQKELVLFSLLVFVFLCFTHRQNILRLIKKQENMLGNTKI